MADSSGASSGPQRLPFLKQLWAIRETLIIILVPIIFMPIPIAIPGRESRCAYVILIMAVYWMTEALPMAVTALLPIVMMPWLDVMGSKALCANYLKDANMLFFGGLLVAVAVEKWGLHKRVALRVLLLVGSKPVMILFGCMSVTGFLSMWLSNTACAAMMIPIACAVLKELDEHRKHQRTIRETEDIEMQAMNGEGAESGAGATVVILQGNSKIEAIAAEKVPMTGESGERQRRYDKEDADFRSFACALKLCVAYASNVGGTGTLIGCGPNIVMKGMADSLYGPNNGVDFTSWFILGFPNMLIDLFISWLTLVLIFIGPKSLCDVCKKEPKRADGKPDETSANAVIRREYVKLGSMTFAEGMVMISFIILALMWLTKQPGIVKGWLDLFPYHKAGAYITDSSIVITVCVILFILPSQFPNYLCFGGCFRGSTRPIGPAPPLLDWPTVNKQMPWSVILLLGGGFALADACKESGLSDAIGSFLISFQSLPPQLVVLIMVIVATIFTTFTSNVSTTTILLPITAKLADAIEINPLYLMLPVTIAASFSYVLPVSTPPNAIVYATGDIRMIDMIKTGLVNCLLHVLFLQLAINTWGYALFNLGTYPEWAPKKARLLNDTLSFSTADPLSAMLNETLTTFL